MIKTRKPRSAVLLILLITIFCSESLMAFAKTEIVKTANPIGTDYRDWASFNPYKFEPANRLVPNPLLTQLKANIYSAGHPSFPHDPSRSNVIYGRGRQKLPTVIYAKAYDLLLIGNNYFQAPAAGQSKYVSVDGQSITIYGASFYTPLPDKSFVANPAQVIPFDPTMIFYREKDVWPSIIYGEPGKSIMIGNQPVTIPAAGQSIILILGPDGRIKSAAQDSSSKAGKGRKSTSASSSVPNTVQSSDSAGSSGNSTITSALGTGTTVVPSATASSNTSPGATANGTATTTVPSSSSAIPVSASAPTNSAAASTATSSVPSGVSVSPASSISATTRSNTAGTHSTSTVAATPASMSNASSVQSAPTTASAVVGTNTYTTTTTSSTTTAAASQVPSRPSSHVPTSTTSTGPAGLSSGASTPNSTNANSFANPISPASSNASTSSASTSTGSVATSATITANSLIPTWMLVNGSKQVLANVLFIPGLATMSSGFRRYYPMPNEVANLTDASIWRQYEGFRWVLTSDGDGGSQTQYWLLTPGDFDPNMKCSTTDDIAKCLHKSFNNYSIVFNREMATAIVQNADGTFSPYRIPVAEGEAEADPLANTHEAANGTRWTNETPAREVVGCWHSHGGPGVPPDPAYNQFSQQDVQSAEAISHAAGKDLADYVSTPDGSELRYDSVSGQSRVDPEQSLTGFYDQSLPGVTKLPSGGCPCCAK